METIELTVECVGFKGQVTIEGVLTYEFIKGEEVQMPSFGNETGHPGSPDEWHFHSFESQTWTNGSFELTRETDQSLFFELLGEVALNFIRENEDRYIELISEEKSDV